jgi:hypothetical protein
VSISKNRVRSFGPVMTQDCGSEPDGNPVATFPPGHVSRLDNNGNLHVYRGVRTSGAADSRPSKLRDAASRLTINRSLVEERMSDRKQLADLNERNRKSYGQS